MKLSETLIKKIEQHIERLKIKKDLSNFYFKIRKSKTSKSIYIHLYTQVNNKIIKRQFRISDHQSKMKNTKVVTESTKFSYIKRRIEKLIKDAKNARYKALCENIKK